MAVGGLVILSAEGRWCCVGREALASARDVLGLPPPPTALSEAQVDRAYKDQARKLHPDRCDAADATKRMQEVVAARDVLKDYLQREFAPDEVV